MPCASLSLACLDNEDLIKEGYKNNCNGTIKEILIALERMKELFTTTIKKNYIALEQ